MFIETIFWAIILSLKIHAQFDDGFVVVWLYEIALKNSVHYANIPNIWGLFTV